MVRSSGEKVPCRHCSESFSKRGLSAHEAACARRHLQGNISGLEAQLDRLAENIIEPGDNNVAVDGPEALQDYGPIPDDALGDDDDEIPTSDLLPTEPDIQVDDIKTIYHQHSGRENEISHFSDYKTKQSQPQSAETDSESIPWFPFQCRLDFEIAEFALKAALNREQTDTLLSLFHRVRNGEAITLENHAQVKKTWEKASEVSSLTSKTELVIPYRDEHLSYNLWYRPLWDWALDLLRDPLLAPHFVWDAQRLYKFNGHSWDRFYHEPWTAKSWWRAQSKLPPGAKPLCFILYADKTKLSSFGTEKGYPVMARCANLPVDIRNRNSELGGGEVVGWLPIVDEDSDKTRKKDFVNLKRVVWHESFRKLLELIIQYAKVGYWFKCADEIERWLFPIILILSSDYEEQCVMACIRGVNSKFPCPICLVPEANLSNLGQHYTLRTTESMQAIFDAAQALNKTNAETLLQSYGLRNVYNVFWDIETSDPYRALSWDRLHAYHGGLFSDHILEEIFKLVKELGRESGVLLDKQMDCIPRWRNLNHFKAITTVTFTDGRKYEDISKVILFALHNILINHQGQLLLRILRSYVELDMYASLDVHTEQTIKLGKTELLRFSTYIVEYSDAYPDKSWIAPKVHTHDHLFDDIKNKGVTRNSNTKRNEALHGALKTSFKLRTNFKDVGAQILQANHFLLLSTVMRNRIDAIDQEITQESDNAQDELPDDTDNTDFQRLKLGTAQPLTSFLSLEQSHTGDIAFTNFRIRLNNFLSTHLRQQVRFKPNDQVIEYRYMKIHYESMVDWKMATDYLRCTPQFHNHPRFDCVMFQIHDARRNREGFNFGRLCFMFSCCWEGSTYNIVLVHPYNAPPGNLHQRRDRDLGFTRLREKPYKDAEFMFAESIIRGALIADDYAKKGDHLVVDSVDPDLWLRLKHNT